MSSGAEQNVCELVESVFNKFIAPDYDQDGVDNFFFFSPMRRRWQSASVPVATCLLQGDLECFLGMIEFARPDRIAMLFVNQRGQGIAGEFFARAFRLLRPKSTPHLLEKT